MNETQMMIAAAAVMVVVAFIGFKILKSLLKAVVLGVGLSAGVAIAWKLGILPRETPTVVEKTGQKVERGVKDIAETVTRGAKQAADEVEDASRAVERTCAAGAIISSCNMIDTTSPQSTPSCTYMCTMTSTCPHGMLCQGTCLPTHACPTS